MEIMPRGCEKAARRLRNWLGKGRVGVGQYARGWLSAPFEELAVRDLCCWVGRREYWWLVLFERG